MSVLKRTAHTAELVCALVFGMMRNGNSLSAMVVDGHKLSGEHAYADSMAGAKKRRTETIASDRDVKQAMAMVQGRPARDKTGAPV